ncbi:MAG: tyrosine-type recombinase/integrase [Opitutales bacterium]
MMTKFVYRQRRKLNGKTSLAKTYSGGYALPWQTGRRTVALKTADKRIAEKRLDQFVRCLELEHEGEPIPSNLWGAPKREIKDLLDDYKRGLLSKRRAERHVHDTCTRIETLCKKLSWKTLDDIAPLGFERWRSRGPLNERTERPISAKTLNEYLVSIKAFVNWAIKLGYMESNPLKSIEKVETRGAETKKRRAWSDEEFETFMTEGTPHRADYRAAVFLLRWTGLRKNELQRLTWGDVFIDGDKPFMTVRSSVSKNHKEESIPLLGIAADYFKLLRPEHWKGSQKVLGFTIPASKQLKYDLKRLDITYSNEVGDLDFHALRHTFGTWLVSQGVPLKEVQVLMRHSDINMTANRYTDVTRLPIARTISDLAFFLKDWGHEAKVPA